MATLTDEAALAATREVLPHWGLEAATVEVFSRSENVVLKVVSAAGETVAVRLHRPGYHSLPELKSEQIWTQFLDGSGIGVPHARRALTGEFYVPVQVADTGDVRQAGIVDWLPGVQAAHHLADASLPAAIERVSQLGTLTGKIDRLSAAWTPPAGFVRHHLDADGLMGAAPFWGPFWDVPELSVDERARVIDLRDALHARLASHGKRHGDYSVIHADLHAHNVLIDGEHVTVIDFDDAGFGWHGYEIAVALSAFPQREGRDAMDAAYLDAYRIENPLPEVAFGMVPTFRLVRMLASVGWVHERPEHGRNQIRPMLDAAFRLAEELGY